MSSTSVLDWIPDVLPCAPRPINGELLSSWARRLAAANLITLPEICAYLGNLTQSQEKAAVFDYASPKVWRMALARVTRIPERWVWALDLQQQFPAIGREWFLHDRARPEKILSGFCPECFAEQITTGKTLHLKAEWTVALVTRCFVHQLPLCRYCPWCGEDQPVRFLTSAIQCRSCEHPLTLRRKVYRPPAPEPWIAALEGTVVEALAGRAPEPVWGGEFSARSFRGLLQDLIGMLTTLDLIDPRFGCALVDRTVADRFLPEVPYGYDFVTPFHARPRAQREAVVCALIQVLLGPAADRALGISRRALRKTAEFRPFVEMFRATGEGDRLWKWIRQWPRPLKDRAVGALAFLEAERTPRVRRSQAKGAGPPTP